MKARVAVLLGGFSVAAFWSATTDAEPASVHVVGPRLVLRPPRTPVVVPKRPGDGRTLPLEPAWAPYPQIRPLGLARGSYPTMLVAAPAVTVTRDVAASSSYRPVDLSRPPAPRK